jgi:hypothetical protein
MIFKDLAALVRKRNRKKERVKTARIFAAGMGVAAVAFVAAEILFTLKSRKEKVESVKDSTIHAAQEVCNRVKDVYVKAEDVKKDIKDGRHKITQDIHETVENISNGQK